MSISTRTKSLLPKCVLVVALVLCFSMSTYAASVVTYAYGFVCIDKDGTVVVTVQDAEGRCEGLIPSNGKGLLRSGQIEIGEWVEVKIVQNKGAKHRGHVTVLK